MVIPLSKRQLHLAGFVLCGLLMGYALYSQYIVGLEPCPLCIFQRVALVGVALVFVIAAVYPARAWGRLVQTLLFLGSAAAGVGVAGRHVYLQNLPPGDAPACSMMSLDYMLESFPLTDVLARVFRGSGECAEIVWQFLGLSMPAWVLIWFVILGALGIYNTWRRDVAQGSGAGGGRRQQGVHDTRPGR